MDSEASRSSMLADEDSRDDVIISPHQHEGANAVTSQLTRSMGLLGVQSRVPLPHIETLLPARTVTSQSATTRDSDVIGHEEDSAVRHPERRVRRARRRLTQQRSAPVTSQESHSDLPSQDTDSTGGSSVDESEDDSSDSEAAEVLGGPKEIYLDLRRKLQAALRQIYLLDQSMLSDNVRYARAARAGLASFRYALRLKIATKEGIRNMFHAYAQLKMEQMLVYEQHMQQLRQLEYESHGRYVSRQFPRSHQVTSHESDSSDLEEVDVDDAEEH